MTTDPTDLGSLLEAAARGDRAAFRDLYVAAAPKLLGIILRIRRDRAGAEEILQDVFLKIWQNAGRFDRAAGPALGWMASIARNRAIDVVRQKTPVLVAPDEDGTDWLERVADPRDREAEMIDAAALSHCLGAIDPEHRECIMLAYCDGWSREELALKYVRPVNTIKTWLHRGLAALKTCLERS